MDSHSLNYYKTSLPALKYLEDNYIYSIEDNNFDYNPFRISKLQNYHPTYNTFFSLTENNYNSIQFNHKKHFIDMNTVVNTHTSERETKQTFIKFSPLVDPIRYLIGKYEKHTDILSNLPSYPVNNNETHVLPKFNDVNNCAYVDCFFNFLSSIALNHHNFVNGIDFYGSYLGIQNKYKMDISDDIDYLHTSTFFNYNQTMYELTNNDYENDTDGSRKYRATLEIGDDMNIDNLVEKMENDFNNETIDNDAISTIETIYSVELKTSDNEQTNDEIETVSSDDSSNDSELNYSTDEDEDEENNEESSWETDSSEHSDSSSEATIVENAYINQFPVQLICLEKCDGTLDELFETHVLSQELISSALFQIVMILITFQKMFSFTHNDLHTNNIMYVNTDITHLYYKYNKIVYSVPTHGKIFKMIDFGRAIYKFKGNTFCSDSFAPGGDAATQYNCEPFMNTSKPLLEPNCSFDLCRLGCSIYDFIIQDEESDDMNELQHTIDRWCKDDNNKNVLYKSNGEDRYPEFKLYKMIARTVHNHRPEKQLDFPYFNKYAIDSYTDIKNIQDIDSYPSYQM